MSNQTINPINHGIISGTGQTVAGAVGGGVKTGFKTWGTTTLYTGLAIGAAAAVIAFTGGAGALGFGTLGTLGNALTNFAVWGALGTGFGAVVTGPFASVFGGIFGAAKGGAQAAERVREEKGAANMMQAQLSAYQAQALAAQASPTMVYAPSAANNTKYDTASTLKLANDNAIQAGASVQHDGVVQGMQLQR